MTARDIEARLDELTPSGYTMRDMIWAETIARINAGEAVYPDIIEEEAIAAVTQSHMIRGWLDDWALRVATEIAVSKDQRPMGHIRHSAATEAAELHQRSPSDRAISQALARAAEENDIPIEKDVWKENGKAVRGWRVTLRGSVTPNSTSSELAT